MSDKPRKTAADLKLIIEERLRSGHPEYERAEGRDKFSRCWPAVGSLTLRGGTDDRPQVSEKDGKHRGTTAR